MFRPTDAHFEAIKSVLLRYCDRDGLGIQLFHMKHIVTKAILACLTRFKVLHIPTGSCVPIYVEINGF